MLQQIILPRFNNKLEEQLINLFHETDLPLHFNKTGNKEFTNYQRISIIILFQRSKKSIRQFIDEDMSESRWTSWLGLKKIPKKSTLHDWLKIFNMKIICKTIYCTHYRAPCFCFYTIRFLTDVPALPLIFLSVYYLLKSTNSDFKVLGLKAIVEIANILLQN